MLFITEMKAQKGLLSLDGNVQHTLAYTIME